MNILFVIIIAATVIGLMLAMMLKQAQSGERAVYENRGNLFTPAERSFLWVLEQALDSRYRVFGKVSLGDLIRPVSGLDAGRQVSAINGINQNHVDFVVCTANELALVGVLELDDQTQGHGDRSGRDGFIEQALTMAGIPILRFQEKNEYAVQEVRARLAEMMSSSAMSATQQAITPINPALDATMESNLVQNDSVASA